MSIFLRLSSMSQWKTAATHLWQNVPSNVTSCLTAKNLLWTKRALLILTASGGVIMIASYLKGVHEIWRTRNVHNRYKNDLNFHLLTKDEKERKCFNLYLVLTLGFSNIITRYTTSDLERLPPTEAPKLSLKSFSTSKLTTLASRPEIVQLLTTTQLNYLLSQGLDPNILLAKLTNEQRGELTDEWSHRSELPKYCDKLVAGQIKEFFNCCKSEASKSHFLRLLTDTQIRDFFLTPAYENSGHPTYIRECLKILSPEALARCIKVKAAQETILKLAEDNQLIDILMKLNRISEEYLPYFLGKSLEVFET